ncbi:MAG TPA: threonine aldolase, partial [Chitinophagaceae bacterium]
IFPVETNIVIFEIKERMTAQQFVSEMRSRDVLMLPISATHVRMVLHLDITPQMVEETIRIIQQL